MLSLSLSLYPSYDLLISKTGLLFNGAFKHRVCAIIGALVSIDKRWFNLICKHYSSSTCGIKLSLVMKVFNFRESEGTQPHNLPNSGFQLYHRVLYYMLFWGKTQTNLTFRVPINLHELSDNI